MAWGEYEDLLESERKKLEDQISDAERSVRDAEKNIDGLQRVQRLLGGGEGQLGESDLERVVRRLLGVVDEINTQERRRRDEQLTLQRLLEGPQDIQGVFLSNGLELDGSFTFSELVSVVADQEGGIDGIEPYGVDLTVGRIERLWEDVSDVDLADSRQQIEESQQTLARLRPIEEQLNQEDAGLQVAALGQLVPPDVISGLVPTAPDARDDNVQAQLAAVRNYTPSAPAPESAAAPRDLGQATTQFEGPPSEFETRGAPAPRDLGQATTQFQGPPSEFETRGVTEERLDDLRTKALADLGLNPDGTRIDTGSTPSGATSGTLGDTPGGAPSSGVIATAAADMSEVQRLLIERFGGITFFLDKYNQQLQVGVTADGSPVPTDDPRATRVMNVVDMMVEYGVVDPNQVLKVVQQTTWYQTTDNAMRRHDALMANMTDLEKKEYFDPVLEQLKDEAVFLGVSLTDELAMQMANDILYLGEADDIDFIRQTLVTQGSYDLSVVQGSSFAAITDSLVSLSKSYYTPIGTADASSLAQDIYFGNKTPEGVEQMFKEQAEAAFPLLKNALAAGITPEQYFALVQVRVGTDLGGVRTLIFMKSSLML